MYSPLNSEKANWTIVLEAMYERQISSNDIDYKEGIVRYLERYKQVEKLIENLELSESEIRTSLTYLMDIDLVEGRISDDEIVDAGLTQAGFQVAHQIKTERQQQQTNLILVVLTAVLVVLTLGLLL